MGKGVVRRVKVGPEEAAYLADLLDEDMRDNDLTPEDGRRAATMLRTLRDGGRTLSLSRAKKEYLAEAVGWDLRESSLCDDERAAGEAVLEALAALP